MPAIVLAGEEELLISERALELKDKLLDPAWASFNFSSALKPDLKQIVDAAAAVPFGPGNKVILFEQVDLFTKKRGGKSDEESAASKGKSKGDKIYEDLEHALKHIAPNTYLILSCTANFDKTLKSSKTFEKHAEIENFEKIKFYAGSSNAAMTNFCRKRAHKFGAVIDDDAINYLAESSEGDLRVIAMEIEKAAIFVLPEKHISHSVVSHLSPHFSNVFALLDHWVHGEKAAVLLSLDEVMSKQTSALPVLALLQTTLSKWLELKTAAEKVIAALPAGRGIQRREISADDMAKRIQSEFKMNPWVLKMELERVGKLKLEYLVEKKRELTKLELSVKTGLLSDVHALSIFFSS